MFPQRPAPRGRHGRSPFALLRKLAVAGGLGLAAVPALAEPPDAVSPGTPDMLLARSVLSRLDADPQLKDINLVVSIVDRVAVIGGSVPTAEQASRAEALIRRVPGIAEVKNRCFVQAGPNPLLRAIAGRIGPPPPPLATELPGVVPGARPWPAAPTAGPTEGALAMTDPPGQSVVARKPALPSGEIIGILLPPVAVGPVTVAPPGPAPIVPPAVLTAVPPAPAPGAIPARAPDTVEAIRKTEARYAGLTTELRGGTLVIAGTAPRAADAWDFAQALRRLPGIARVVVGAVDVR